MDINKLTDNKESREVVSKYFDYLPTKIDKLNKNDFNGCIFDGLYGKETFKLSLNFQGTKFLIDFNSKEFNPVTFVGSFEDNHYLLTKVMIEDLKNFITDENFRKDYCTNYVDIDEE